MDSGRATETTTEPLLSVDGLVVEHRTGERRRTLLSGVTLKLRAGETLGIVGESGSGKSMMAKAVIGLLPRGVEMAAGRITFEGTELNTRDTRRMRALRGPGISMMMQDPFTMLNPVLTCGEQVSEGLRVDTRLSRREAMTEAVRRLREVGLRDAETVAARYPFQLSGGMRQRVALAAALSRDPRLLIADEPSTALDVTTQAEILDLLASVQKSRGMGLLLITHDLRVAFSVCAHVSVMYAGRVLEAGPTAALQSEPLHPYTLGLLLSEPSSERRLTALSVIEGSVPEADEVSAECAFARRCQWSAPECRSERPLLVALEGGRASACRRVGDIRGEMAASRSKALSLPPGVSLTSTRAPLVEVRELRKVFLTSGRREVIAVNGVSIAIGENESVGLVGESGSGKTTVGRCLLGLETPSSGRIRIGGIDASNYGALPQDERRRLRGMVQIIFQDPYSSLDPKQSIGAALAETLRVNGADPQTIEPQVTELLTSVGLPAAYAKRTPARLSGGERQRVAIARALAVGPRLIVCDEPVSSLDVSVQAQVLNLLGRLRTERQLSYLFITHDLAVVRQVADRVYVLYEGSVVEEGEVDAVLDRPQHPYTQRLVASIPRSQAASE